MVETSVKESTTQARWSATPRGERKAFAVLRTLPAPGWLLALLLLSACSGAAGAPQNASAAGDPAGEATTLRLGYFPNVTHAPALVGLQDGIFRDELDASVELQAQSFNSGTEAVTALFSNALDVTYIGPGPATNAWQQSGGEAVRLIAGATSGGAALVVREGIAAPADLVGTRIASPSLGNTQDIALRAWLAEQGLEANLEGGGEVAVVPQSNAQTLETFQSGAIDGAWVPEPWATRIVQQAGGRVLVDERELWPDGQFVTTHILVRRAFLEEQPQLVEQLLRGHVKAVERTNADPRAAQQLVNDAIEAVIGERLSDEVIAGAWDNLTFTVDPIATSLQGVAEDAVAVGLMEPVDLRGIYDLRILNRVLAEVGGEPVDDGGLG